MTHTHRQLPPPITVYCWDADNRYSHTELADPDPAHHGTFIKFLVPDNATLHQPPTPSNPKFSAFWDAEKKTWVVMSDEKKVKAYSSRMRVLRNQILESTDWTQMPDVPMDGQLRGKWAYYRQQLRDLPEQAAWPFVGFPEQPTKEGGAHG